MARKRKPKSKAHNETMTDQQRAFVLADWMHQFDLENPGDEAQEVVIPGDTWKTWMFVVEMILVGKDN